MDLSETGCQMELIGYEENVRSSASASLLRFPSRLVFYEDGLYPDWDLRIRNGDGLTVESSIACVLRIDVVFDCVAASLIAVRCGIPDRFCLIPTWTAQLAGPDGSVCRAR
jgi:hypothetical protein